MVRNRTSQGQPAVPPAKASLNTPRLVFLLLFGCLLRQTVESHKSRSAATKYTNVSAASGLVPTPHKCVLAVVYTGRNKHGSWRGVHLQKIMQESQRPKRHGEKRSRMPATTAAECEPAASKDCTKAGLRIARLRCTTTAAQLSGQSPQWAQCRKETTC